MTITITIDGRSYSVDEEYLAVKKWVIDFWISKGILTEEEPDIMSDPGVIYESGYQDGTENAKQKAIEIVLKELGHCDVARTRDITYDIKNISHISK